MGESLPGIPTGRDVEWEPLLDYRRNGVSETTIHGAVAWASGGKMVHSFGGNVLCYGRSMMKPLTSQTVPLRGWVPTTVSLTASHHSGSVRAQAVSNLHG